MSFIFLKIWQKKQNFKISFLDQNFSTQNKQISFLISANLMQYTLAFPTNCQCHKYLILLNINIYEHILIKYFVIIVANDISHIL